MRYEGADQTDVVEGEALIKIRDGPRKGFVLGRGGFAQFEHVAEHKHDPRVR